MTSKKNKARSARETNRKFKKKANPLKIEKVEYIDYKDVNLLQKFMSDRSKIRGQKLAGVSVQEQRDIANAIKNAREMALLPYTKRTVSTRAPRAGADRREEEGNLELEDAEIPSNFVPEDAADETTVDTATEEVEA
ncbi:MAG: ribosomal protein [Actinomycetota bacterium]|jgi:small subunit ribosomal protein S18|nr:30S ribosomal protein S18 [Actinomycetota bacterium]